MILFLGTTPVGDESWFWYSYKYVQLLIIDLNTVFIKLFQSVIKFFLDVQTVIDVLGNALEQVELLHGDIL